MNGGSMNYEDLQQAAERISTLVQLIDEKRCAGSNSAKKYNQETGMLTLIRVPLPGREMDIKSPFII